MSLGHIDEEREQFLELRWKEWQREDHLERRYDFGQRSNKPEGTSSKETKGINTLVTTFLHLGADWPNPSGSRCPGTYL